MLNNHIRKNAEISIATIPVAEREASEFGILKKNDEGFITSFIEKPKKDVLKEWKSDTGPVMQGREEIIWPPWGFIFSTGNYYGSFAK